MNKENVWIGLLEVSTRSRKGVLGNSLGAFVNVLALAKNRDEFIEKVKISIDELELDFVEIAEIELFSERNKNFNLGNELISLAEEVVQYDELRFGDFHTYKHK
ncbi:MAG: hypothetical protein H6Q16_1177 [Bacteroidetes bacterium]|nr:hypothetical protein [Bacteroidota bacterium]